MNINRRHFLGGAALLASSGLLGYSAYRGVRMPTLHWDPSRESPLSVFSNLGVAVSELKHAWPVASDNLPTGIRALAPSGSIQLQSSESLDLEFPLYNLHSAAEVSIANAELEFSEHSSLPKVVRLSLRKNTPATLSWTITQKKRYRFAAIGDSGGDLELQWCLRRAEQLEVDFLLHLGDFNYQAGDYQRAIDYFNHSPIPVYVSIGNHDFNDGGAIYQPFLQAIGPFNYSFELNGARFVNVDTAANFLPVSRGARGAMLRQLQNQAPKNTLVYTHRPLLDPGPESTHDIGSNYERDWLYRELRRLNTKHYLAGHIHIKDRQDFRSLDHIIVGQGLGHQDLLTNSDYSKILIGELSHDGQIELEMTNLAMPMNLHCSQRTQPVRDSLRGGPLDGLIQEIERACDARLRT